MTSEEIVSGKNLAAKSAEVDFAIVLSRVIVSIDALLRLATPRELYKCRMFKITTFASSWETAVHVYPKADG